MRSAGQLALIPLLVLVHQLCEHNRRKGIGRNSASQRTFAPKLCAVDRNDGPVHRVCGLIGLALEVDPYAVFRQWSFSALVSRHSGTSSRTARIVSGGDPLLGGKAPRPRLALM